MKEVAEKLEILSEMLFNSLKENVKLEIRIENLEKTLKDRKRKEKIKKEVEE